MLKIKVEILSVEIGRRVHRAYSISWIAWAGLLALLECAGCASPPELARVPVKVLPALPPLSLGLSEESVEAYWQGLKRLGFDIAMSEEYSSVYDTYKSSGWVHMDGDSIRCSLDLSTSEGYLVSVGIEYEIDPSLPDSYRNRIADMSGFPLDSSCSSSRSGHRLRGDDVVVESVCCAPECSFASRNKVITYGITYSWFRFSSKESDS